MIYHVNQKKLFNHRGHGEHGGDSVGTGAFAMRMGQGKNSASKLARFLLFFCQSQLAGIIRANQGYPWLLSLQPQHGAVAPLKTYKIKT
jgi:hypothetical protein